MLSAPSSMSHSRHDANLPVRALTSVGLLLAITLLAPRALLLIAPLLFGVPHVAQDLRCLWLRIDSHLPRGLVIAVGLALLTMLCVRAAYVADLAIVQKPWFGPRLELGLGLLALALSAAFTRATMRRRAWVLPILAAVGLAALRWPQGSILALGHLHNFVALALLCYFLRRVPRALVLSIGAAITILMAPPLLAFARSTALDRVVPEAFDWASLERTLAPGAAPEFAARLVLIFAFAQALHYLAWLHWIPRAVTPTSTTAQDFGRAGFIGLTALAIGVPLWGYFDPLGARTTYLTLVFFHGWIELAVIVHLALRSPAATEHPLEVAA